MERTQSNVQNEEDKSNTKIKMTIDISTQQIIVTLLLGTIAYIDSKYGDSGTKHAHWFFIGGFAGILLICYWMYYFLIWVAHIA